MQVMQKLENGYLAILRFVAVVTATFLLVATVIFGLGSLGYFRSEPKPAPIEPKVEAQPAISAALSNLTEGNENKAPTEKRVKNTVEDPVIVSLRKSVAKLMPFVQKTSNGQISLDEQKMLNALREDANNFPKGNLRQQYADGLSVFLDAALADPRVVSKASAPPEPFAQRAPSIDVIVSLIGEFTNQFDQQMKAADGANKAAYDEYIAKKTEGQQSFYEAGIAFGTFLSVVFLFIIIKIERNLRAMVPKDQATEA